jgi:hypothetical protein
MAVAIAAPELYPYLQGMNALNSYNNNDILGALSSGFGAYTGLTGNNPLLTNKGIEQVNTSGLSTGDIKNINTGFSVGTALRDKNYASLFNTAMQQTDTKLPSEVGAGLKLASAFSAYSKGDYKGLMNNLLGFAKSTDPKVADSAQRTIADINNGVDGKVALNNFAQNVGIPADATKVFDDGASLFGQDPNILKASQTYVPGSVIDLGTVGSNRADPLLGQTGMGNTQIVSDAQVMAKTGDLIASGKADLKTEADALGLTEDQLMDEINKAYASLRTNVGNTIDGTQQPSSTTDPETGLTTHIEDIGGSKVTSIFGPDSRVIQQTSENADGTKQVTTNDGVNKTIKEYDADGNLISESTVPVKPTDGKGDENIPTITVIGRPDPTIAIPSGGTPSTTVTTPVVPTAPVPPAPVVPVKPLAPVVPAPAVPVPTAVAPAVADPVVATPVNSSTPITIPPTTKTPTPTVSGGASPTNMPTNFGGHTPNPIVESLLKTYMTKQAFKDPLASLEKLVQAQQKSEKDMIDPRLASILQQRSAPKDSGYYKYGQEPTSVEDILSLKDSANQTYKTGGHVQPLAHASGGALPVVNNRHDFRHGAHVAGEGDGTSDDIPAMLADGEFVFPADVVSALGNGSTKAGTDKLYEMMHSIRARARKAHPSDLPQDALKSPLDYLKGRKK